MEVTFGAVGDFISIGVLIKDFIELLDDSRGSAWEYNSLKQQLMFLRLNLDLAKRSYDDYYNTPQFQDIRNTLESVVDEAERRLEDIAVKVQKYTSTLSQGSNERRIRKVVRKVQWSLEKKETEKFLLDLNRYTSIIQSLQFNAFAQKDQSDTQELVNKLQKDFDDRFTGLEDELRAVKAMSGNTQQHLLAIGMVIVRRIDMATQTINSIGVAVLRGVSSISYFGTSVLSLLSAMHSNLRGRLERPPHMGPYFIFEDYLGVESIILLSFMDSWNAFEGSLYGKFKGRKGGRRVAQNRFLLQDQQTGDEIDRDAHWSLAIKPGSRINMSLICEVNEDKAEAQSHKCPFPLCGAMCEGLIGVMIQCPSCQQLFRKLPCISDYDEVPVAPKTPGLRTNDPAMKFEIHSSDLAQSRQRKGGPSDKRRALRAKTKPTGARSIDSDSDDDDLTGIKRVSVLPIWRIVIWQMLVNDNVPKHSLVLLRTVFDANSLGKWIYDWSVYVHGPTTPISNMAGEFWLLLIQLAGKFEKAEGALEMIESVDSKEVVQDFIEAGERLWKRLQSLLKKCEVPMLEAYRVKETGSTKKDVEKNAGVVFINMMFGKGEGLKQTERLILNLQLYNLRFDAICEPELKDLNVET
ncbi:vegetative cell wall gp1 [Fusarium longipes]|uniref:Vegetative cell wall gp1 n=1 Tax=Fusarium longipes TaxID=694270 RepID=A0A395T2B1_9HYPO|nr:vegetative cell wall gp1 [Fusarium longipes]